MAQSVERHLGKVEVTGSIPVISFYAESCFYGFRFFYDKFRDKIILNTFCWHIQPYFHILL